MLADYHHVLDMRRAPAELMIGHVEGEDHILLEGEGVFARHLRPHRNRVIGMFEADRMRRGDDEARKASIVHGLERQVRSEEHTSELQSLMRSSYAVFCLKKQNTTHLHLPLSTI